MREGTPDVSQDLCFVLLFWAALVWALAAVVACPNHRLSMRDGTGLRQMSQEDGEKRRLRTQILLTAAAASESSIASLEVTRMRNIRTHAHETKLLRNEKFFPKYLEKHGTTKHNMEEIHLVAAVSKGRILGSEGITNGRVA